jgi:anti-sigma regulatory factor (Ser/Thr protein kinase)
MEDGMAAAGTSPLTGQAPSTPAARWRQKFPGEEREMRTMRRWLESVLPACPARDDVMSVVGEFAVNSVRHTASGRGGKFTVEVTWLPGVVRVAVADGGAPGAPRVIEDPSGESGRGLLMVRGLSLRSGVCGDAGGRVAWADLAWDGPRPDGEEESC